MKGGNKMKKDKIHIKVTESSLPPIEEYIDEIKDLWKSKWLTNMGTKHQKLEKGLEEYLKVPNVKLFTNGHAALEIVIATLEITGEVITTPFTFASTTQAIVQNDLEPVFCDIKPDDFTIDPKKIEELITDKTSAIIPVHVYGNICDVYEIEKIAKKHNLKVIYDAAHVFGVEKDGKGIGKFGDASMFSFHATKVFNTVEGGGITYSDASLSDRLDAMKNFGLTSPERVEYVAGNAKMSEFHAAMGLVNLNHVDEYINKRKKVAEHYINLLKEIEGIHLVEPQENVKNNYAYFPVLFDHYKKTRDEVYDELLTHGVQARKYFYPLTNGFDVYEEKFDINETPIAKYAAENVLTLPLYSELDLKTVEEIVRIIKN